MAKEEKSKTRKVISVVIILILIGAVAILFYQNTQNKMEIETELEELKGELNQIKEEEMALKNEIQGQNTDKLEKGTSTEVKDFTFHTPVGESGEVKVSAEKAFQATGFAGASAHVFYLREGNVYYQYGEKQEIQLASGIVDLKQEGEDIIAVKGENAKILTQNQYIVYEERETK